MPGDRLVVVRDEGGGARIVEMSRRLRSACRTDAELPAFVDAFANEAPAEPGAWTWTGDDVSAAEGHWSSEKDRKR